MHSLEGSGSWSHLGSVSLCSLGLDGSVSNDDNWPLEFSLKVINDLASTLAVVWEGSEWDPYEHVLAHGSAGVLKLNLLGGVDVDELKVLLEVSIAVLEGGKGLGEFFLELSGSLTIFLLEFASVEHRKRVFSI